LGVLLVTNDQKEDWWAEGGGATRLARPELVSELLEEAGQPLIMLRAHELVGMGEILGVTVKQATVSDAELSLEETEDAQRFPRTSQGLAEDYREFWERLEGPARARGWIRGHAPSTNWWPMSAGGGGNNYTVSFSKFGCRSELYLGNPDALVNLHRFGILQSRAEEMQTAYGPSAVIEFDELPHAKGCRVEIRLEDGRSIAERELWDETLEWFISTQEHLREAIETTGGIPTSVSSET